MNIDRLLKKIVFPLFLIMFCSNIIRAQNAPEKSRKAKISGKVVDGANSPLSYVNVTLYRDKDSVLVTGALSDAEGKFQLNNLNLGKYTLKFSYMGFKTKVFKGVTLSLEKPLLVWNTVQLQENAKVLSEVQVVAEKPGVQYKLDKKIVNIEQNLVSAGGTALDVMRNVPSISVDVDGNVSLRGNSNVNILIDGRPSGSTGESLSSVLDQIPASSIENIEIITNPSAKYDPEGTGGIINIILKKEKRNGLNGMVSLNAGTRDKYTGTATMNYRINKFNFYGTYDARAFHATGTGHNDRTLFYKNSEGAVDSTNSLIQDGNMVMNFKMQDFKIGSDYFINSKNTLGFYFMRRDGHPNRNMNIINSMYDNDGNLYNNYQRLTWDKSHFGGNDYVLNYRKTFDKKDQEFTADFNYSRTGFSDDQNFNQNNLLAPNSDTSVEKQFSNRNNHSNRGSVELNYVQPLGSGRLEAGYKLNYRQNESDYKMYDIVNSDTIFDSNVSNHFKYNEQIHSLFATYGNTLGKLQYQLGSRLEQAFTSSQQKTTDQNYSHNYLSFFPSVHLNYKKSEKEQFQLSYSRRINRPRIWNINPFTDYSDPKNLRRGNPQLNPEYINSYEVGYSRFWKNFSVNSDIFYHQTLNMMTSIKTALNADTTLSTFQNLSSEDSYGGELILQNTITKWWNVNTSFTFFRTILHGVPNSASSNQNYSWSGKLNSNMTLMKNLSLQIIGSYDAPVVTAQGKNLAVYGVDLGLRKDIFKSKAYLTARVSDIFNTRKFESRTYSTSFNETSWQRRESQIFFIGLTFKINGGMKTKNKDDKQQQNNEDLINSGEGGNME
ncbi:MAG: TonB dependent receptor [Bacteroidota bacterium]|nr:TonB dependent receptor [Bacteroidota bacterium]